MSTEPGQVTVLLHQWKNGDEGASQLLFEAVYTHLHGRATRLMQRERAGHTLQATALVNEAFVKLVDQRKADFSDRAHFLSIAAMVMRRVLVDHARSYRALKRGGDKVMVTFDEQLLGAGPDEDVLEIDSALEALAAVDERQAKVVELRFFAGLTVPETAVVMALSPATVKREWAMARAWLYRHLRGE